MTAGDFGCVRNEWAKIMDVWNKKSEKPTNYF